MRIRMAVPQGPPRWARAVLLLALAWAVAVAPAVLPLGDGRGEAHAASPVTVMGPKVWQPAKGTYGRNGWVTVSQTKDLSNQVIQVSWFGFTPSATPWGGPPPPADDGAWMTLYPVRIYQCRGTNPDITDCYGSTLYGGDRTKGFRQKPPAAGLTTPEFPTNAVVTNTSANGRGEATIEVWTAQQSQTLGCDPTHQCSLVVEAEYGGNSYGRGLPAGSIDCDDHRWDADTANNTPTASDAAFRVIHGAGWASGEACAWTHRAVIPLTFGPTPDNCPERAADLSAQGLEMANRAMQQWRAGLCQGDGNPLSIQYTFGGGEPQARRRFLDKAGADIALTARPDSGPAARPYVYAPLANTGISVAFVIDDGKSQTQIRQMKLNARLLAKMLTQSYRLMTGDIVATVSGNPQCILGDPEFLSLNPVDQTNGPVWPRCGYNPYAATAPVVVGGTTDLVRQLTEWIASDPDASLFLQGAPDEWGMHVNTAYLKPQFPGYPVDSFVPQDYSGPNNWKQYEWNPVIGGLGEVLRKTMEPRPTCLDGWPDNLGNHPRCNRMSRGERQLFAIMDAGQAAAMSLPQAALKNPAGGFVTPTLAGMQAAVSDMVTEPTTGTQRLPYGDRAAMFAKDQQAYPLTTVQYAMLPTAGLAEAKAAAVSQFVKRVTDPGEGQIYGWQPGRLAVGFLGLTQGQSKQAQEAVQHVAAQDGALPGNQGGQNAPVNAPASDPGANAPVVAPPSAGDSGHGAGANAFAPAAVPHDGGTGLGLSHPAPAAGPVAPAAPAASAAPSAKPSPSPSGSGSPSIAPIAAGQPAPDRPGMARVLLPTVLVLGAVLLIGGPAALMLGGTAAGARLTAGAGRVWGRLTGR